MPNEPISNDEIEDILGYVNGKPSRAKKTILRSNKIVSRHYVKRKDGTINFTTASLAAEAIRLLADCETSIEKATSLVASSSTPDQLLPNHAVMVHGELGVPGLEAVSTSGICMCGVTALKYAYFNIASGEHDQAISSATEVASGIMRSNLFEPETSGVVNEINKKPELAFEKDFLRWMLSDGSGAMMLSSKPRVDSEVSLKIEWIDIYSHADKMPTCMYQGAIKDNPDIRGWSTMEPTDNLKHSTFSLKQDVKLLNENILKYTIEESLPETIKKHELDVSNLSYFLPHISSGYFEAKLDASLRKLNIDLPIEKWFSNLTTKGNTGCASIYIMLDELINTKDLKKGEKILCFVPESGRFSSSFFLLTVV